jgi:hypothetical protein
VCERESACVGVCGHLGVHTSLAAFRCLCLCLCVCARACVGEWIHFGAAVSPELVINGFFDLLRLPDHGVLVQSWGICISVKRDLEVVQRRPKRVAKETY